MDEAARWTPRVTVAAVASRSRDDGRTEYLLVEERTRDGLRLNNPAGHLDPGETPAEGAAREALEETARPFEPTHLVGVYLLAPADGDEAADAVTWLRFAYAGRAGEPEPGRALDTPVVRTLWLTLDELRASTARHRSPLVLRTVEDAAAGRAFPLDLVASVAAAAAVSAPAAAGGEPTR